MCAASTDAFELMLAAFILGLALGGLWVRKHSDQFTNLLSSLAVVQVLMGIAAIATLLVYDQTFDFLAWLLAISMDPVVDLLERRGVRRG